MLENTSCTHNTKTKYPLKKFYNKKKRKWAWNSTAYGSGGIMIWAYLQDLGSNDLINNSDSRNRNVSQPLEQFHE